MALVAFDSAVLLLLLQIDMPYAARAVVIGLLGLHVAGSTLLVVALAAGNAVLGMSLGLFVSAFARSEFQVVQFMPAFVFPQLLLCGLFVPRDQMAPLLEFT